MSLADYAATADSVSVCFSKGLGAPVGSALAGSFEFVERARDNRKRYGGAMRQAGIIAAGAIYALEHNMDRLVEDHENAATLASYLREVPGLEIGHPVETNIVIADVSRFGGAERVVEALKEEGVLCGVAAPTRVRFVTHLDVTRQAVRTAGEIAVRLLPALGRRPGSEHGSCRGRPRALRTPGRGRADLSAGRRRGQHANAARWLLAAPRSARSTPGTLPAGAWRPDEDLVQAVKREV